MDWRISALNEKSIKPREEAIEKIENYIVKNELQAEDRLPSERTMCELWNCNRSTLRKAIKQLILEGRIYNKNGSGTYVAPTKLMRNLQDARGFQQTAELAGRQVSTKSEVFGQYTGSYIYSILECRILSEFKSI